jgi:hypothetical protein
MRNFSLCRQRHFQQRAHLRGALRSTGCAASFCQNILGSRNRLVTASRVKNLSLSDLARVLVRFDHIAVTDLTHFRIFLRNLEPDFTQ